MDWKNLLKRALWTFFEGFLGALTFNAEIDKAALLAAVMAGLSAIKTFVVDVIRQNK